jgi:hypothetical protein
MNPREVEDAVARDILGWKFVKDTEVDYIHTSGPGWYKQDEQGELKFMGWPEQWATNMDAMWKLAGQLSKQHHMTWSLNTWSGNKSKVKLSYLPYGAASIHHSVEAEANIDEMPLAMCLALLKMIDAKKAKTADGLKTV